MSLLEPNRLGSFQALGAYSVGILGGCRKCRMCCSWEFNTVIILI